MSFFDDLTNFGSGMLDSVGEGFDNLVTHATTPTQTVNATTQKQGAQEADNHGNIKTSASTANASSGIPTWAKYAAGGLGVAVLVTGLIVLAKGK